MSKYLVIGGSGDIGRAIVNTLLFNDHEVICHYHSNDQLHFNGNISYWKHDLSADLTDLPAGFDDVDGMIYAAGTSHFNLFQDDSDEMIEMQYRIHVLNMMKIVRSLLPYLIRKKFGRLIIISSIWGETGASMEVTYSTMKSAQLGFVKALAKELGMSGITVNAISPGFVKGRMNSILSQDEIQLTLDEIPQGEFIDPDEIAALCQFLLQDQARHITGQVLRVNGGWLT